MSRLVEENSDCSNVYQMEDFLYWIPMLVLVAEIVYFSRLVVLDYWRYWSVLLSCL